MKNHIRFETNFRNLVYTIENCTTYFNSTIFSCFSIRSTFNSLMVVLLTSSFSKNELVTV